MWYGLRVPSFLKSKVEGLADNGFFKEEKGLQSLDELDEEATGHQCTD